MASGKNAISLDIHRICKPEEVLSTKQANFWKDKEVLQEEKVTTQRSF